MNETEIKINKIAQGVISFDEGKAWFENSNRKDQQHILYNLNLFLQQVHPKPDEVLNGIHLSQLKKTYTPCVLISKKPFKEALNKILMLPQHEWKKAYILLMSVFIVADQRRRDTQCKNGCTHDWHNIAKS